MKQKEKRSYWKQLCSGYRESGATMHEFCRRCGVTVDSLKY